MDGKYRRNRAVAGSDLFQRQRVADMVSARPAPFRRHQRPHKAELAELGQRLFREPCLAIPFGGTRRKQVLCDVARGIAEKLLFLCEPHPVYPATTARSLWSMMLRGGFLVRLEEVGTIALLVLRREVVDAPSAIHRHKMEGQGDRHLVAGIL